jgi:hypothetical protein
VSLVLPAISYFESHNSGWLIPSTVFMYD